jgi:polysaccharide export outer membrane protein
MKTSRILFATLLVLTQWIPAYSASAETTADDAYLIQPGDVLEISVWKEEDLLKQVLVTPDGGISFPLVGNVSAAGHSIAEIQSVISGKLSKYIPDPVVSVAVQQLTGNKIYVIGKVARPGEFVATRYMDVVQALSLAGGMTPYAASNKISILRRSGNKSTSIPFRYGDIEKGENLQQNIILNSGDVVVVP